MECRCGCEQAVLESLRTTKRTLLLCGLSQSWRYPAAVDRELRRSLHFIPDDQAEADQFHRDLGTEDSRMVTGGPSERGVFRVGVHVRRGDFLVGIIAISQFPFPPL